MSHFQRTAKALAEYDKNKVEIERQWLAALTPQDTLKCARNEFYAVRKVQSAFFADTAHVNSWDRAKLVHPDDPWLRKLVQKHSSS